MISVTKLDSSFPNGQFNFMAILNLGNGNGGGILVFIREDMPAKLIDSQMKIEGFFIELNLR